MRFFATISLILLFAVSQYARQLSYIECKVTNIFKADTVKCDCEKTSQEALSQANKETIPAKIHFHPSADEFFLNARTMRIGYHLYISVPRHYNEFVVSMTGGHILKPYHPPRSFC